MAKAKNDKSANSSFFKNPINIILIVITLGVVGTMVYLRDDRDGMTGAERLMQRVSDQVEKTVEGCDKPKDSEVEAHFKDKSGSIPVARDFDADPGEICGNGKTFYCTSKPPQKPIPSSWKKPPRPGEDPTYEGPSPFDAFKESPYAMPAPKVIKDRKPVVDFGDRELVPAIEAALQSGTGKLGYLGNRQPTTQLSALSTPPVVLDKTLFDGQDDEVVAKALTAQGIEFVLVDRTTPRAKAWIEEKMNMVRVRLRDAVSLAWFHPMVVGSGYALFKVAEPFVISKSVKRRLTRRARNLLTGQASADNTFTMKTDAVGDSEHRVIVSLRKRSEPLLKGRKLIRRIAHGKTVVDALDGAVKKIQKDWNTTISKSERLYGMKLGADLKAEMANLEIEIDVVYNICALTDRSPMNMVWYLELGLEGLMLKEKAGKLFYLEPSYAVHMEVASEVVFLEKMLMKSNLDQFLRKPNNKKLIKTRGKVLWQSAWAKDTDHQLKRFRTVSWIERPQNKGGDIVELYRGIPLKTIWDVSKASLVKSLELGAHWLMANQTPDGQYAYKYKPINKPGRRWTPGGNIVRHALNPYTLLMVNKIKQDPKYVASAKKGIEFSLKFLRHEGNRCCICHRDPPARYYNAKLNAVAVTILSILKLGDVADISEYKDVLNCMAEEMLYMQDKNGHFWQYDVPPDHPYYGAESTIHAGEFIFVLARLYSHYKDEKYKVACDKAIQFYMKQWRKALGERTPQGIFDEEHRVNLIGIVPWLVTAMQDLYQYTGDMKYAELGFEAQDWIDDEFFWWQNRAQYPDYVGASFKVHKELPAVNSCQYAEGAAAAYDIAKRIGRDVEKRRQVVVHSMRFCLQLQYEDYDNMFFLPVPEEALGGYRYTLGHLRLRNDYNYHAMAAIAQAAEYLEPEDYPAERPLHIIPVLKDLLGDIPGPTKDVTLEDWKATTGAKQANTDAGVPSAAPKTDTPIN